MSDVPAGGTKQPPTREQLCQHQDYGSSTWQTICE